MRNLTSDAGADGEIWFHLSPGHVKWYGATTGCWVHESVLVPSRGMEADLLYIADRMLTAPEGHPLIHWVAAHNLFVGRVNSSQVAASVMLSQRRRELLKRALEAADSRDQAGSPLVLAWIESLGDEAAWYGYPDSPKTAPVLAPSTRELAIIASDVACRFTPSSTPELRARELPLGFHFLAERHDTVLAGEAWTPVQGRYCLARYWADYPRGPQRHRGARDGGGPDGSHPGRVQRRAGGRAGLEAGSVAGAGGLGREGRRSLGAATGDAE